MYEPMGLGGIFERDADGDMMVGGWKLSELASVASVILGAVAVFELLKSNRRW